MNDLDLTKFKTKKYGELTVTDTPIGFPAAEIKPNNEGDKAELIVFSAKTMGILFLSTGENPDFATDKGMEASIGDYLYVYGYHDIQKFRAVRNHASTNATIKYQVSSRV